MSFSGTSGDLFESMQLVKVGGDLDANDNIVNYFHGIIAGLSVRFREIIVSVITELCENVGVATGTNSNSD